MTSADPQWVLDDKESAVDARLKRMGWRPETAVGIVAVLIVLVADSQALSLIPLLPTLEVEYKLTPAEGGWALSILPIVAAAAVPTITRLGDRVGMRRLVLLSLVAGVLGNVICMIASDAVFLILGRAVLGLSAALPLAYAILRERSTSIEGTNRGVGLMTAAVGLGIAVSYLLGGVIIELHGNMHTVFGVMAALALITLVLAVAILPDSKFREVGSIDVPGGILLAVGLASVVLAIAQGNAWGWGSLRVLGLIVGGLVVLVVFCAVELRVEHPLINLRRSFDRSAWPAYVVTGICLGLGVYSNLAVITYLEMPPAVGYGLGFSVLVAAIFLCPVALFIILGGITVAPLIRRFGVRGTMLIGGVLTAVGFFWLMVLHTEAWHYLVGNVIWGLAFSCAYSAANAAYLHAAGHGEAAMFSAANTAIGYAFTGLAISIFTVVLTAQVIPTTPIPAPGQFGWLWFVAAMSGVAIVLLALVYRSPATVERDRPVDTQLV